MRQIRNWTIWASLVILSFLTTPSSAIAAGEDPAPAKVDTFAVWASAYREIRAENILLRRDLANARVDSVAAATHWQADRAALEFQIEILKDQIPAWYERPGFVAVAVAVVTIFATLQAVQISF